MSRKSTLMRKEQEILAAQAAAAVAAQISVAAAVPVNSTKASLASVHRDEGGESSDDDEEDMMKLGDDGKPRISWDRNVRGDKNGLKTALMTVVYEHKFHLDGKLKVNFKKVSELLSVEGSKFDRFSGISASGAQRKYNNVLRDVAKTFKIGEVNEIADETDAEAFETITLKVLRDLIEREKAKKGQRVKRDLPEGEEGAAAEDSEQDLGFINKKRKSDVLALRNAVRSAAGTLESPVATAHSHATEEGNEEVPAAADEDASVEVAAATTTTAASSSNRAGLKIHRLDKIKHDKAVEALKTTSIVTVGDLFKVAGISQAGCNVFVTVTGVKLERPVDRFLKLYEEVAADNEFVSKMKELTGMTPGDILEVEAVIRPLY